MLRRLLNESDTRILGEQNFNSRGSNTAPLSQRADYKEVITHFREVKMEAVAAGHVSIPTFPSSNAFDSVRSNNSNNLKNCAQIKKAHGDLALGLSITVHLGRVGGVHPTKSGGTGGKIGTRREFFALFIF